MRPIVSLLLVICAEMAMAMPGTPPPPGVPPCNEGYGALARYVERVRRMNQEKPRDPRYPDSEDWMFDGKHTNKSATHNYNSYFMSSLDGKTIEKAMEQRKKSGKSTNVADFFGSAVFSDTPEAFDSLTGVRLAPLVRHEVPKQYPAPNWREVTGDVYERETWNKLDADMKERGIAAYDLILCRPEGPLRIQSREAFTPGNRDQRRGFLAGNSALLNRMWQKLSRNDGILLQQLTPELEQNRDFQSWLEEARELGVNAEIHFNTVSSGKPIPILKLTKSATSPAELPR